MANRPQQTPLVQSLPATVPFVGPETQERARGRAFRARIGANESGFGPSPAVAAAMAGRRRRHVEILRSRKTTTSRRRSPRISAFPRRMSWSAKALTGCSA